MGSDYCPEIRYSLQWKGHREFMLIIARCGSSVQQKVRFGREVEGGRGEEGGAEISCDATRFPV